MGFEDEALGVAGEGVVGEGRFWKGRGGLGDGGVGVGDAVEAALGAAAAGGEPEGAVGADGAVGDVEGAAGDEVFLGGGVRGAVGFHADGDDAAVGPVTDEEGVVVGGGELGAVAEEDGGGGREADVEDAGEGVGVVGGPATGAASPAVVGSRDDLEDAGGHVPGGADVAFHVGVEGEEVAVLVEGEIEGIAEAGGDELDVGAVWLHGEDVAGGEFDVAIEHGFVPGVGEELVVGVVFEGGFGGEVFGEEDVVAVGDPESAVGTEFEVVATVAGAAAGAEEFVLFFEGAVVIGIAQAVEGFGAVGVGVEPAVVVEEAAAFFESGVDDLGGGKFGVIGIGEGEAEEAFFFHAEDEATGGVEGHGDPGILFGGGGVDELDLVAGWDLDGGGVGGARLSGAGGELPRVVGVVGFFEVEGIGGGVGVGGAEGF